MLALARKYEGKQHQNVIIKWTSKTQREKNESHHC